MSQELLTMPIGAPSVNIKLLEEKRESVLKVIDGLVVNNQGSSEKCAEYLTEIASAKKFVTNAITPLVEYWNGEHKKSVAFRNTFLAPFEKADETLREKLLVWQKSERERIEKERREEAARIESARVAAAKQAFEAQKKAAEEAAALKAAQEADDYDPIMAEMESEPDVSTAIIETFTAPAPVPEMRTVYMPPSPKGIGTVTTWTAELTDLRQLVMAVASGAAPLTFLMADMSAINKVANTMKGDFKYAGLQASSKDSLRVRGAR